ncbi:DUF4129 domain-containing protein [Conexibacter sp. DBS9H8]|uniref:DUF4129 domain-containing protein n=1 Tax=Conexibacter sp. DBS9H8 TaxID=2937801 RepID=UPI00200D11A3|nr:DUF4129 domain-containing protein [Conexibacter sp. DBS9H8]
MHVEPQGARLGRGTAGRYDIVAVSAIAAIVVILAAGLAGPIRLAQHPGGAAAPHRTQASSPAQAAGAHSPRSTPAIPSVHRPDLGIWPLALLGLLVLAALGRLFAYWWGRRRAPARRRPPAGVAGPVSLAPAPEVEEVPVRLLRDGIGAALGILDSPREPADAIVRAWLALEARAERSGIVRRPAETPTEFTRRVLGRAFPDQDATTTLLGLYLATRFSERPPAAADVSAAREALERLQASWQEAPDLPPGEPAVVGH